MEASLDLAPFSEKELQTHFDAWTRERSVRVGTPPWMEALKTWAPQQTFVDSWGVSFRPDTLAHDGAATYAFELKFARKYEPLALPEVLHHAHALRRATTQVLSGWPLDAGVRPVIVSQFNAWIRDAREFLLANGFRSDALRVLEVAALRDTAGRSWLWFNELDGNDPWVPVTFDELEPDARAALGQDAAARHYVRRGAGVFARLVGGASGPDAYEPGTPQRRIARTSDGSHWLTWDGTAMESGAYRIVERIA